MRARLKARPFVDLKNARLVDFSDKLCTGSFCQSVIGGEVVFRDSNHLTSSFARRLAPFLEREMDSLVGARNGIDQPLIGPRISISKPDRNRPTSRSDSRSDTVNLRLNAFIDFSFLLTGKVFAAL